MTTSPSPEDPAPEDVSNPENDDNEEAPQDNDEEYEDDQANSPNASSSIISVPVPSASECQYTPCYCEVSKMLEQLGGVGQGKQGI